MILLMNHPKIQTSRNIGENAIMKIQILEDLYNEVNRLFIAGSKFTKDDPRISKLIPVLRKMGEKSPVMNKLAEYAENLVACDSAESSRALLETGTFLYSVLSTQGSGEPDEGYVPDKLPVFEGELPAAKIPYLTLKPVIEALTESKSGRLEVVKDAYENGLTNDFRLYSPLSKSLGDKYAEIVNLVYEKIIPSIGRPMEARLLEDYDFKGGKADARRLSLLYGLKHEGVYALAEQAMAESSSDIQAAAINILKDKPENEEMLLSLAAGKKGDIREAALLALVKINSKNGKRLLLETLQSANYKSALDAASACEDKILVREMFEYIQEVLEVCKEEKEEKKKTANIEKFGEIIRVLHNHEEKYIFDFYREVCVHDKILPASIINGTASHYFSAAYKIYSPEEQYDTFLDLYAKDFLYHVTVYNIFSGADARFDKRWLSAFIKKNDVYLVCAAMRAGDKEAVKYLVKYLEKGISGKKLQPDSEKCFSKLIDIGYKGLDKIAFSVFENCSQNYQLAQFCDMCGHSPGRIFSKDYIKKFDKLYEKTKYERFAEIANNLR